MFYFNKIKSDNTKKENQKRITALKFLNQIAFICGDKTNNIICIPYKYNDNYYNLLQYRTNISGNIEIYSENHQLIFVGNDIFNIYDFISSIIIDSNIIDNIIINVLKDEYK